ncbi:MAG: PocR ligand-binding domain-containing protein [Clostridia bacterium]|nr:PocR ligand-binding domain-containing protein [Clostridia bacterium]
MEIQKLKTALIDFHVISGMHIAVMDREYRSICFARNDKCNFCEYIHKSTKCLETCVGSDTARLKCAAESGKLIMYTCPFGVFEAIQPIVKDGELLGFLFLAMGIEQGAHHKTNAVDQALRVAPNLDRDVLALCVDEFPCYSYEKFESYARMLPVLSEYIAANDLMSDEKQTLGQLVKIYVKNNISKKITLADLSWNLHCSTVTLTEHFKREFDMTIMQYVTEKKMHLAERMLSDPGNSVNDVAEACGFSDVEYFSRCFKGYHGMSPVAWRKQYRENNTKKRMDEI